VPLALPNSIYTSLEQKLLGTFLSWLNDHDSNVFVVATCNNIRSLPPEFVRAERFDGVFFTLSVCLLCVFAPLRDKKTNQANFHAKAQRRNERVR
jgi:SpoVK/Ycf46/Vps4 family AAA+-type ATPase